MKPVRPHSRRVPLSPTSQAQPKQERQRASGYDPRNYDGYEDPEEE